jgi:hypothetical protein
MNPMQPSDLPSTSFGMHSRVSLNQKRDQEPSPNNDNRQDLVFFIAQKTEGITNHAHHSLNSMIDQYLEFDEENGDRPLALKKQIELFSQTTSNRDPLFYISLLIQICTHLSFSDEEAFQTFNYLKRLFPHYRQNTDALHEIVRLITDDHFPFNLLVAILKITAFTLQPKKSQNIEDSNLNCLQMGNNRLTFHVSIHSAILKIQDYLEKSPANHWISNPFLNISVHKHIECSALTRLNFLFQKLFKNQCIEAKSQIPHKQTIEWLLNHESRVLNHLGFNLFSCFKIETTEEIWSMLTHLPSIITQRLIPNITLNHLQLMQFNAPDKYKKLIASLMPTISKTGPIMNHIEISAFILKFLIEEDDDPQYAKDYFLKLFGSHGSLNEEEIIIGEQIVALSIKKGAVSCALIMLKRLFQKSKIESTIKSFNDLWLKLSKGANSVEQLQELRPIAFVLIQEPEARKAIEWLIEESLKLDLLEYAQDLFLDLIRTNPCTSDISSKFCLDIAKRNLIQFGATSAFLIWDEGNKIGLWNCKEGDDELTEFLVDLAISISNEKNPVGFIETILQVLITRNLKSAQEIQTSKLWPLLVTKTQLALDAQQSLELLKKCNKQLPPSVYKLLVKNTLLEHFDDLTLFNQIIAKENFKTMFKDDPQFLCKIYQAFVPKKEDYNQQFLILHWLMGIIFNNPEIVTTELGYLQLTDKIIESLELIAKGIYTSSAFLLDLQKNLYTLLTILKNSQNEDKALILYFLACENIRKMDEQALEAFSLEWCTELLEAGQFALCKKIYDTMSLKIKKGSEKLHETHVRIITEMAMNLPEASENLLPRLTKYNCPLDQKLFVDMINIAITFNQLPLLHHLIETSKNRVLDPCQSVNDSIEYAILYLIKTIENASNAELRSVILRYLVNHKIQNGILWKKYLEVVTSLEDTKLEKDLLNAFIKQDNETKCIEVDSALRIAAECLVIEELLKRAEAFGNACERFKNILILPKTATDCTKLAKCLELILANTTIENENIITHIIPQAIGHLEDNLNYFKCARLLIDLPSIGLQERAFALFMLGLGNVKQVEDLPKMNYRHFFSQFFSVNSPNVPIFYDRMLIFLRSSPMLFKHPFICAMLCVIEKRINDLESENNTPEKCEQINLLFTAFFNVSVLLGLEDGFADPKHVFNVIISLSKANCLFISEYNLPQDYVSNHTKLMLLIDTISIKDESQALKTKFKLFQHGINLLTEELITDEIRKEVYNVTSEYLYSCLSLSEKIDEKHAKQCLEAFLEWNPTVEDPLLLNQLGFLLNIKQLIKDKKCIRGVNIDSYFDQKILCAVLNSPFNETFEILEGNIKVLEVFLQDAYNLGCFDDKFLIYCELHLFIFFEFPESSKYSDEQKVILMNTYAYADKIVHPLVTRLLNNGSCSCILSAAMLVQLFPAHFVENDYKQFLNKFKTVIAKSAKKNSLLLKVRKILFKSEDKQYIKKYFDN